MRRISSILHPGNRNASFAQVLLILLVVPFLWGALGHRPELRAEAAGTTPPAEARSAQSVSEYKIKAAFLYNFLRYTTWPEGALGKEGKPIELVVVGKNPFGTSLDSTFDKKKVHGRPVHIRYLSKMPKEPSGHLVFATGLSRAEEDQLLKAFKGKPTMLIGDSKGYAERGSCANFYIKDSKVRFQVNPDEVKRNGLEISSQLLKLASIVKTKGAPK